MATNKELEDKRSRLMGQEQFHNPKNKLKPAWFYKHTRPSDADAKYESAKLRANMVEQEQEARMKKTPAPNSRAQYEHEKDAGGALTDLSYEEWKKL